MDRDDQSDELIWSELMMPHIAADDARDLIETDPGRRGFGHCVYFNVGLKPHSQIKDEMARFMAEMAPAFT